MRPKQKKMLHDIIHRITEEEDVPCGLRHGVEVKGTRLTKEEHAFIAPIIGAWIEETYEMGTVRLVNAEPIWHSLMDIGDGFYYIYLHDKAEACRMLRNIEAIIVSSDIKYDDLLKEGELSYEDYDDINEYFPAAPSTIKTEKIALQIGDEQVPYDRILELVRNSELNLKQVDVIESEKVYTKDEVIDLLIDISVGCPQCGLGCNDGFLKDNCRMPNCKPDRDERECWRKWLEYREENPDE